MIKNIVFDIGNVILNFDYMKVISQYTDSIEEKKFILDNIINSPEWLEYSLIDTGFITKEEAIQIVQDRTNHINDNLVQNFWNNYNNYAFVDKRVLNLIERLKNKGYKVYLLSNMNEYTFNKVKASNLFNIVDGYVLSYLVHQVKPYISIYKTLINKYNLRVSECLFIDDNEKNIDTANSLGMIGRLVKPDNYEDIEYILKSALDFDNNDN